MTGIKAKLFCAFLVLTFITTVGFAGPISKHCYDNTVAIKTPGGHGSGVMVSPREGVTFIWTAAHVLLNNMRPDGSFREFIITQGNKIGKARVLRCGDCHIDRDIGLLIVTEGNFKGTAKFYREFNEIELGQEVIHCGNPFNTTRNENLLFYGHISHIGRMFFLPGISIAREVDQCALIVYPGCSGGPVCDAETGGILGVVSIGGRPGLSVIVPTRFIYEWAKSHDCLWAFDPEVPLPKRIIPWPGDSLKRLIKDRDTSKIDERWGSSKQEVKKEPANSGIEILF